ncbi:MAG: hypothetical protein LM513_01315, partial [Nitrospira sp.]|nr:hypothetical protein [Nitrospira sp.]
MTDRVTAFIDNFRRQRRPPGASLRLRGCALLFVSLLAGQMGCDRDPVAPSTAAKPVSRATDGIVQLTAAEIGRAGIQVQTVKQEPFVLHREFPATVHANENELAEVTTLIRGRVVEVLVDAG